MELQRFAQQALKVGESTIINIMCGQMSKDNGSIIIYGHNLDETEAAKRLLKRLAEDYPKLPVCIQGDSLYETEPLMEIYRRGNWKYLFTHKAARQKLLDESYEWIRGRNGGILMAGIRLGGRI